MICDECPLQDGCIERRGLCRDYIRYMERIEEARRKIGQLNEDYKKAAGRSGANEGGVQKARARDLCSGDEGGRDPERVRTEARTNPETEDGTKKKRTVRKKERKPRAVFWTAEKEERLIQMYKDGAMYEEMAKVFGKSRGGISARIQKLANQGRIEFRYNAREWTAEDLTIMKEMRAEGKSFWEIADRLGRGYKACSEQYRRTYGKDS